MPNFTKNAIKASFIKLLSEKQLRQITVKDIVTDCGVNRNSFYYHFEDIPSLVDEMMSELSEIISEKFAECHSFEECMLTIIDTATENRKIMLNVFSGVDRYEIDKYLNMICGGVIKAYINESSYSGKIAESDKRLIEKMYIYEFAGFFFDWLTGGLRDDIRSDVRRLCKIQHGFLDELLRRCCEEI